MPFLPSTHPDQPIGRMFNFDLLVGRYEVSEHRAFYAAAAQWLRRETAETNAFIARGFNLEGNQRLAEVYAKQALALKFARGTLTPVEAVELEKWWKNTLAIRSDAVDAYREEQLNAEGRARAYARTQRKFARRDVLLYEGLLRRLTAAPACFQTHG